MTQHDMPVANYAAPGVGRPRSRSLVVPIVLCALGVIMIVLGGCFLIGVAQILFGSIVPQQTSLQRDYGDALIVGLYICAGVCFIVAAGLLWSGVRRLTMLID
jgi:hypothetical protein